MTLTFHALWMLCALGAIVLVTAAVDGWRTRVAAGAGLALSLWLFGPDRLPDVVVAGALTTASAAIVLFRPRYALVAAAFAGALAGMFSALLEVQALPSFAATAAALAVMIVPLWLARSRPQFAPDLVRDEALLFAGALGVAVAVLPGVLDGWHAAANLAATSERRIEAAVPMWTIGVLMMSTVVGAMYSLWSRR